MKIGKITEVVETKKNDLSDVRLSNRFLLSKRDIGLNEMRFLLLGLAKGLNKNMVLRVTHAEFSSCWQHSRANCPEVFRRISRNIAKTVISVDEGELYADFPLVEKNIGVKSYSGELRVYLNKNLTNMFKDFMPGNPYFTSTIMNLRKFSTLTGINLYLFARSVCFRNPTEVCLSNDDFQLIIGTHYRQKKFLINDLKPVIRLTHETDMHVKFLKSPRGYVRMRITSKDYPSVLSSEFGIEYKKARTLISLVRRTKEDSDQYLNECIAYCRDCIRKGKVLNVQDFVISTITDYRPTIEQLRKRKSEKIKTEEQASPDDIAILASREREIEENNRSLVESIPGDRLKAILTDIVKNGVMSGSAKEALKNNFTAKELPNWLLFEIREKYETKETEEDGQGDNHVAAL